MAGLLLLQSVETLRALRTSPGGAARRRQLVGTPTVRAASPRTAGPALKPPAPEHHSRHHPKQNGDASASAGGAGAGTGWLLVTVDSRQVPAARVLTHRITRLRGTGEDTTRSLTTVEARQRRWSHRPGRDESAEHREGGAARRRRAL